ncbi:MAG: metallophosphoesterase [Ruminococcaceae bacterium]|nr:metallophosphoesterase [Oscillospiraceae bacterium]
MTHLHFKGDNFRICQLTDIHLEHDRLHDERECTCNVIRQSILQTKPDLVVFTGDLAWGPNDDKMIDLLSGIMEELGVPWAPVLGNHDGQDLLGGGQPGRRMFAGFLLNRPGSLFELGPEEVFGNGNYTVTVGGTKEAPAWVLFLLDSPDSGFDVSQLLWYKNLSESYPDACELAFFHIPLQEYTEVWDYHDCLGFNQERVCSTPLNDGLFSLMVRGGKMKGVFVGHDHINDFEGTLHGIRLCYGRGSGYQCYGLEGYPHGARIIDLSPDGTFSTKIWLETGELYIQTRRHVHKLNCKG